jgi:acyl carrier protein
MNAETVDVVLEIASSVFRQPVKGEDRFSELGVNSLCVIRYCQQLEERLGLELDVQQLFEAENLASFGALLATRVRAESKS